MPVSDSDIGGAWYGVATPASDASSPANPNGVSEPASNPASELVVIFNVGGSRKFSRNAFRTFPNSNSRNNGHPCTKDNKLSQVI